MPLRQVYHKTIANVNNSMGRQAWYNAGFGISLGIMLVSGISIASMISIDSMIELMVEKTRREGDWFHCLFLFLCTA